MKLNSRSHIEHIGYCKNKRADWIQSRKKQEQFFKTHHKNRDSRTSRFDRFAELFFGKISKSAFYAKLQRNALDLRLRKFDIFTPNLPFQFDYYNILHISDMHLGCVSGLEDVILKKIKGISVDLLVFTGDYWAEFSGPTSPVIRFFEQIIETVQVKDAIIATLGNHDTYEFVAPLEKLGIYVLAYETLMISRDSDKIYFTGIDDTWAFSHRPVEELVEPPDGFCTFLSHTPDTALTASMLGYSVFLCGHTHGGQLCLPGGVPIVTRTRKHRNYASGGLWFCEGMIGYTNPGAGSSGIPVRMNCPPEIALITYRKKI